MSTGETQFRQGKTVLKVREESGGSVLLGIGKKNYRVNGQNWKRWKASKSRSLKVSPSSISLLLRKAKGRPLSLVELSNAIVFNAQNWHLTPFEKPTPAEGKDFLSRRSREIRGENTLTDVRGARVKR